MGFFKFTTDKEKNKEKNKENKEEKFEKGSKAKLDYLKRPVTVVSSKGDSKMVEIPLKNGELLYANNINRESFAILYSDESKTNLYTADVILIGRGYPIRDNIAFELPIGKFALISQVLLDGYLEQKDLGREFKKDEYNYLGIVTPFDAKFKISSPSEYAKKVIEKRNEELRERNRKSDKNVNPTQEKIYKDLKEKAKKKENEITPKQDEEIKRIDNVKKAEIVNDKNNGYNGINIEPGKHYGETLRIRNVKRYSSSKNIKNTKNVYTAILSSVEDDKAKDSELGNYQVMFTMPHTININGEQIKVGLDQVINNYYDEEKAKDIQKKLLTMFSKAYSEIENTQLSRRKKVYDIGGTDIYGNLIENKPEIVGPSTYNLLKTVENSFEEKNHNLVETTEREEER